MLKKLKIGLFLSFVILFSACNKQEQISKVNFSSDKSSKDFVSKEQTTNKNDDETEPQIPWGFDEYSYPIYKSGALEQYIPEGSQLDQCQCADLDLDGIDDLLLTIITPIQNEIIEEESQKLEDLYEVNTVILKGLGNNEYQFASENSEINYYDIYLGTGNISAGQGWFKFTRSRGTAGGWEYNYLFKFDENRNDWFYTEFYHNRYGYIDIGESIIRTPDHFGVISFEEYGTTKQMNEAITTEKRISIEEERFKFSTTIPSISLVNKEKEAEINKLIEEEINFFIENLRNLDVNIDILLSSTYTFLSPEIVSLEYSIFGSIDSEERNFGGENRKYFTTLINIDPVRRLTLSDIIDIEILDEIILQYGFSSDAYRKSDRIEALYFDMPKDKRVQMLKDADELNQLFGIENIGVFSTIYEKSICIYLQQDFWGVAPEGEEPKLYVLIDHLLPYVKVNIWDKPSEAASHIIWIG